MRQLTLHILLCQLLFASAAYARGEPRELTVQDPYIEMRTGPGRGYPIFYVAERGESIVVLRRRTDWYQVQAARGEQGWVYGDQLERTLELDGTEFEADRSTIEDYAGRAILICERFDNPLVEHLPAETVTDATRNLPASRAHLT